MAVRHRLTDADTLEGLSLLYFGDELHVPDIITYNNLVYPYTSTDNQDKYLVYARGYVYVRRQIAQTPVTVKQNWKLKTKPSILNSVSKTYVVTEDVTLPTGTFEAYLPIRSLVPGLQGNTVEETIQILGEDFGRHFVSFVEVNNTEAVRGGTEGKVLTTGEYIFLPTDIADMDNETTDAGYNQARYFYGDDLKLTDDDLTVSDTGDLATVGFADNVMQSVEQRLKAEKGDNPSDYNFGHNIPFLVGNGKIPQDVLPKRVEIEILEALEFEDRIHTPEVKHVEVIPNKGVSYVDVDVRVVSLEEVLEVRGLRIGGNA